MFNATSFQDHSDIIIQGSSANLIFVFYTYEIISITLMLDFWIDKLDIPVYIISILHELITYQFVFLQLL